MKTIAVRFESAGPLFYYKVGEFDLTTGDWVLVERDTGTEVGQVVVGSGLIEANAVAGEDLRPVLGKVSGPPLITAEPSALPRLDETLQQFAALAEAHNLPVKVLGAEQRLDQNGLVFYLVAENIEPAGLAELGREAARQLGVKVELRQVGIEAGKSVLSDIGACERVLCCGLWQPRIELLPASGWCQELGTAGPMVGQRLPGVAELDLSRSRDILRSAAQALTDDLPVTSFRQLSSEIRATAHSIGTFEA